MPKIKRRKLPNDHGLTHKQEISRRKLERKSRIATDPLLQWKAKVRIALTLGLCPPRIPTNGYSPEHLRAIRATKYNALGELRR